MIAKKILAKQNVPSILLILGGIGVIVLSILADFIGVGGKAGFGRRQMEMAALGAIATLMGVGLLHPGLRHRLANSIQSTLERYEKQETISLSYQVARSLLIAGCFGLVSGLLEGLVHGVFTIVPDQYGWRRDLLPQILWIAPLFNMLLFLLLAVPPTLLGRYLTFVPLDLLNFTVFGWLAIYGPLSTSGRLEQIAVILLTLGIVIQIVRFVLNRPLISNAALVRASAALSIAVLFVGLGGSFLIRQGRGTRQARTSGAPAAGPNVLLIVIDTLRADHLSSYGYARPTTPNIDQLAEGGVLFEKAFATDSWTLPSHASLFTGRYGFEHGAGGSPLDDTYPTLAEVFRANGYATAGFSANIHFVTKASGLSRGFDTFKVHYSNPIDSIYRTYYGRLILDRLPMLGYFDIPGRKRAATVNEEFTNWLQNNGDAPFFAFLNYFDVHDPYLPPSPYDRLFTDNPITGDEINSQLYPRDFVNGRVLSQQEIQAEIDGYDGALAYVDAQIGALLAELDTMGLRQNTLVIVASDHGESFGTHGLYGHGNSLYYEQIHVPLILSYPPRIPQGVRVADTVGLESMPATLAELVLGSESGFPGKPLANCWNGSKSESLCETGFSFANQPKGIVAYPSLPLGRRGAIQSFLTSDWHLILHEEGNAELYDLRMDHEETTNLADSPSMQSIKSELEGGMEQFLATATAR